MEELKEILEKFISSGWALIADPARKWLEKGGDPAALIEAIRQADAVCGRCGCELDPLYRGPSPCCLKSVSSGNER